MRRRMHACSGWDMDPTSGTLGRSMAYRRPIASGGGLPLRSRPPDAMEREMAQEATELLAEFAATLSYDDLPERVREHCKNLLLDALACAVAGNLGEETPQLAALASGLAQSTESSVIGGERLSLAGATLLNAYLVTATTSTEA